MRLHHHLIHSTLALVAASMSTSPSAAQDCGWETVFNGMDAFFPIETFAQRSVAVDVDGDGDQDTIATISGPAVELAQTVMVLLNEGDAEPILLQFQTLSGSNGTAVGDFDDDGVIDIAFALTIGGVAVHRGVGDGTFEAAVTPDFGTAYGPPWSPFGDILAIDTDDDGLLDLVATDPGANAIGVLRGLGGGSFEPAGTYATGTQPAGMTSLDADLDGDIDLVVTIPDDDTITVLLNAGDGTYAHGSDIAVGGAPRDVTTGDFDGDGIADLAVAEYSDWTITTLKGIGDGTFNHGATRWVPGGTNAISAIDLDGDAYTDLVSVGHPPVGSGALALFTGNTGPGDAGIAAGSTYSHDGGAHAVADLTGDGIDDVGLFGDQGYRVLPGRGDGTLDGLNAIAMGGQANTTGDLNGDGIPDLVATSDANKSDVRVALGRGDGSFDEPMRTVIDDTCGICPKLSGLALGDIDDDGDLDVLVTIHTNVVLVLRNAGDGTLTIAESYPTLERPEGLSLADLDEDGALDLVVVHGYATPHVQIRRGLGDGTFGNAEQLSLGTVFLAVADLNGDGHLDLIAHEDAGELGANDYIARRLGNGDGTFGLRKVFVAPQNYVHGLTTADIDEDGNIDVIVSGGTGYPIPVPEIAVFRGTGTGFFDAAVAYGASGDEWFIHRPVVDDFNGDGTPDVAAAHLDASSPLLIFPGAGDGTLGAPIAVNSSRRTISPLAADFDGNGTVDIAAAAADTQTTIHLNQCAGTACAADVDGDGSVGVGDLLAVLSDWGACPGCVSDIDGDGDVSVSDLLAVLSGWGACP